MLYKTGCNKKTMFEIYFSVFYIGLKNRMVLLTQKIISYFLIQTINYTLKKLIHIFSLMIV